MNPFFGTHRAFTPMATNHSKAEKILLVLPSLLVPFRLAVQRIDRHAVDDVEVVHDVLGQVQGPPRVRLPVGEPGQGGQPFSDCYLWLRHKGENLFC